MGELRIGTRERELAMGALDEHMRAGRLDPHEYAERSATASTARLRSELDVLFVDLPAPHPTYPRAAGADTRDPGDPGDPNDLGDPDTPGPGVPGSPPVSAARESGGPREDDLPELVRPVGSVIGRHAGLFSALTPVVVFLVVAASGFRLAWLFLLVPVLLMGIGWLGHRHDNGR